MTGLGLGAHGGMWLVAMAAVFLLAGCIKGVVGLGLPTVSMALLALLVVPAEAAALLIVPSLVTNLWQLRPWATLWPLLRRLGGLQWGICAGTWLGAWLLGAPAGAWSRALLGVALIAYAVWGLLGARLHVPPRAEAWLSPLVGLATGGVTAATGVFVVPAVPYLQALGLHRDALVQAMGLCFTVSTLALAGGLALNASYPASTLVLSAWMLVPALLGMALGTRIRQRMSAVWFRRCLMVGLLALGVYMVADVVAWHGFASR
ncbi:hypothetical protein ASF11_11650 [Acidovorax sp. Leaf76]|uniref:sulfite exporter TauE/SafE family protein n=1 Tax=unclassified Acidovorax TaxID=2684926 RepID=UPI0006F56D01|nr:MULTISPECIES: sulfite exporter TauE/SafE family protein [unclassified Acidovorax]KQO15219.1 hypothetical protein ASF11_11650 [Acidovorax sp. Leaf76]KQO32027.1 hypothetical protein ASF19_10825 [Acidovorax sp. Leaf84]KQS29091.1 hypothetical protein ASG27_12710 [Acidovorax sp. Leaf191]